MKHLVIKSQMNIIFNNIVIWFQKLCDLLKLATIYTNAVVYTLFRIYWAYANTTSNMHICISDYHMTCRFCIYTKNVCKVSLVVVPSRSMSMFRRPSASLLSCTPRDETCGLHNSGRNTII